MKPKLNKAAVRRTARAILAACKPKAKPELGFNMQFYRTHADAIACDLTRHDCNTVACIAGWVLHVHGGSLGLTSTIPNRAAKILGIEYNADYQVKNLGNRLFAGFSGNPSPQKAAAVLFYLADTGRVNWSTKITYGQEK